MIEFTPRQQEFFNAPDARINILPGAVRSGKTFISLAKWVIKCVAGAPLDHEFLMIGKTLTTLKRNCLGLVTMFAGTKYFSYSMSKKEARLFGHKVHLEGANDDRSESKIRGMTLAGCYGDEVTLFPEDMFMMLLSRLSIPGSVGYFTCNPDTPYHYIKKSFIDKKEQRGVSVFPFILDDNGTLDPDYVAALKREYTGHWYRRYILGEWCAADGVIYDMFDQSRHVIQSVPDYSAAYYRIGIDYGTNNPTVFCKIGINKQHKLKAWCEKTYYWDSHDSGKQKTDSQYVADFISFVSDIPKTTHIIATIDPSAASFIEALRQAIPSSGKNITIQKANNDVLEGIQTVSRLLQNDSYAIVNNKSNAPTIKGYYQYQWDDKAQKSGIDKPKKVGDHTNDAERYALHTEFSTKAINYDFLRG